ncbi:MULTISPECIES: hypothetical protein [Streptomyces]|uniref:hypothetical protein n=1 Tax=Streptomyces TaxID=1883 RepID=UPI000A90BC0B|nr:hypothetical protein [Streptomyces sp. EN16]
MERLIKKMAQDNVWQNWLAANSAQQVAKNGCIRAPRLRLPHSPFFFSQTKHEKE